jgi:hypothetical protein
MLRIILLLLLMHSTCANARMYQWTDPESGSTQLSGSPPMWYRSAEGGPRVFVFDNTRVVDDTSIAVSNEEREYLRQQAFLRAEKDRESAKEKLINAKSLNAALMQKKKMEEDDQEQKEQELPDEELRAEIPVEKPPATTETTTMEQMREVIEQWERVKTEKARGLLGKPGTSP